MALGSTQLLKNKVTEIFLPVKSDRRVGLTTSEPNV
jgi:hypothetical protein